MPIAEFYTGDAGTCRFKAFYGDYEIAVEKDGKQSIHTLKFLKKGIRDFPTGIIFALAFILAYFTNISTVLLVVAAGAAGYVLYAVHSRKEKKV